MEDLEHRPRFDNSEAVVIGGKIMLAAIIVLFLVVVFVIFLHFYVKWYWRRRVDGSLRSRPSRRRFVFAPNQDPIVAMHRGLEPSVLRSLPVLIFHPHEFKDDLECAVCLCEISDGEKARLLPKCNHGFHVDCIDMWFQSHSTCPLCRIPVTLESANPSLQSRESLNFPTNVLFWENQTHQSTGEEGASSSPSSSTSRQDRMLKIEIPRRFNEGMSSLSPSTSRFGEEESESPMTTRLRSLKRLLSWEKRVIPCSPSSVDVEQGEGGRGQCSKSTSDY